MAPVMAVRDGGVACKHRQQRMAEGQKLHQERHGGHRGKQPDGKEHRAAKDIIGSQ